MGDYTNLRLSVRLNPSTPPIVLQLIKSPLADIGNVNDLDKLVLEQRDAFPAHELFSKSRCFFLLGEADKPCDENYLSIEQVENGEWHLNCHKSIKNYEEEIESLLDWLTPYALPQEDCGTYKGPETNAQTISFDGAFKISDPEPDDYDDDGFWIPNYY